MSIINHEHKHVFIHVPRTAGTAMEQVPWVGGKTHHTIASFVEQGFPQEYVTWAFVRHPFDRLLSTYSSLMQQNSWPEVLPDTFEDFVRALPALDKIEGIKPMSQYLCVDGRLAVKYVGRFEQLLYDWAAICGLIVGEFTPLPKANQSTHKPWQEYYTPELADIVYEHYKEDYMTFGYHK